MHKTDLVRVHEAGIAHHVAAVRKIDGQDGAAAVLYGRSAVVVQLLVIVRGDVAPRENFFEMLEEISIHGHQVFKVAVLRAIFDHQDLAVALDDLRFNLADLLIEQHFVRQLAVEDLLADFRHAARAQ